MRCYRIIFLNILWYIMPLWTISSQRNIKKRRLPIGAIFDWDDDPAKTGFLFAISRFNVNRSNEFKLSAVVTVMDVSDSYNLATTICSHMSNGVFMLFGARRFESSNIVQAYTHMFNVPYLSPSYPDNIPRQLPTYQLHMKPSHTKAMVDLIIHFQWKTFYYVYDSGEGLFSMQEILRVFEAKNYDVNVRIRRLHDVMSAHEDLRALDKQDELDNNTNKYILLDLSTEKAYHSLLKQIREVGMNKQGYNYILGTLDFLTLDMERYQYGGVNITGFQLVNYSSVFVKEFLKDWSSQNPNVFIGAGNNSISVDAALAVDAITVIQQTLSDMLQRSHNVFQHTFRRGDVYNYNKTKGVPCNIENPVPWMLGKPLMEGMTRFKLEKGVTGNIEFDHYGFRKNYAFDVFNVGLNNGPSKIGQWSHDGGVYSADNGTEDRDNRTDPKLKIVTSIEMIEAVRKCRLMCVLFRLAAPFLIVKTGTHKNGKPFIGNDKFEGFCIDLAKHVARFVGFDYKIQLVKDGKFGNSYTDYTDHNNVKWNGMIGEVMSGEADLAIAGLSIKSEREVVVDFSKPFMEVGISIMIKKPEMKKPDVHSFLQPFTISVWICIVVGYVCVGGGIFFVSRVSSAEWRRSTLTPNARYNKFTLANSLWFAMGSLMLQGSDDTCPRSASGRIIGGAWWFAVLIMISSYTANLAAFLTIEKLMMPIESAGDLVNQDEIIYGTLDSGATRDFFTYSNVPTYRRMDIDMRDATSSVFVKSIAEGIERVRNSKGKYAFLLESVYNEYENNRKPCNTMKVGRNLNSNHYGIATMKNSPLRQDVTLAVLSLTEDGTLEIMKNTWWVERGQCGFSGGNRESKKKSLSLSRVVGIYFILMAGLAFAILVCFCEFIYTKVYPGSSDGRHQGGGYMMPATEIADTLPLNNWVEGADNNHVEENGPNISPNGSTQQIDNAAPFLMIKTDKTGKPLVGNDRFEGFCADLAEHVARFVGFDYKIQLVKDGKFGNSYTKDNEIKSVKDGNTDNNKKEFWNGMIGEVIRGEADLAIAGLSIKSEREEVVDFSKPFMEVGISIMIKKPEIKKPGVFSFLQPFTINLWMCIVVGYVCVGGGIFLVSRISSAEWRRSTLTPNARYNKFTLANSMWFAMGSLMLQGSDDTCPRSASGRIIGGAWWFAVLIMISSYTANLAAFLTIEKLLTPIESADDLLNQNEIAYGTLDSGASRDFFINSNVPTYKSMGIYMQDATNPTVFVKDIHEGIERVRNSKGKYAFLLESVYNEYENNRKPCNTMKVGHNLNSNHYGIATKKNSPLRDDVTLAVLSLTEDGTLEKMKKTWWVDKGQCGFSAGNRESKKKSLSLNNVAGIYFILISGLVLSIIIGVCEFIYTKTNPESGTGRYPGVVYMMPATETVDTLPSDNWADGAHNNHRGENGPTTAPNGSTQHGNHVPGEPPPPSYASCSAFPAVPKISFDIDTNTSV